MADTRPIVARRNPPELSKSSSYMHTQNGSRIRSHTIQTDQNLIQISLMKKTKSSFILSTEEMTFFLIESSTTTAS